MNSPRTIPIIGIAELPRDEELLLNVGESYASIMIRGFTLDEFVTSVDAILEAHEEHMTDDVLKRSAQLAKEKAEDSILDDTVHDGGDKAHQALIDKFKNM